MSTTTAVPPCWLPEVLKIPDVAEGTVVELRGQSYVWREGVLRELHAVAARQAQTSGAFGFKWRRRDSFDSPPSLARMRNWLIERYGDVAAAKWLEQHGEHPVLLDAGCGAGMSALELFGPVIPRLRYVGVDISEAVDVARSRFLERGLNGVFIQADLARLPMGQESVDILFSEGVMHHTPSTQETFARLARLLKHGGRFLFYVYRRKGPIREFTDDYVRDRLQALTPEEAWLALRPLTALGIELGKLDVEVDIPEPVELLGIPAGRVPVQRLIYWHFAKLFHSPDLSFDEMHHINFDWYAPAYAHRHTPEEVRAWCADAGLDVEREVVQEAGITVVARKR